MALGLQNTRFNPPYFPAAQRNSAAVLSTFECWHQSLVPGTSTTEHDGAQLSAACTESVYNGEEKHIEKQGEGQESGEYRDEVL